LLAIKQQKLIEELSKQGVTDKALLRAFLEIDRSLFVPSGLSKMSSSISALPLKGGQWISSPLTVAKMTMALRPRGADNVLEIGCGSGYQAAVLSKFFRRVFTIERIEKLLIEARAVFRQLGILNINTRLDDGAKGWAEYAPYDRILLSACADEVPQALLEQMSPSGGILVAPITQGKKQIIARFIRNKNSIIKEEVDECLFVPLKSGIEKA
jgi:protein-L-isoaspartate(D-aspartate) O-methyltransferase